MFLEPPRGAGRPVESGKVSRHRRKDPKENPRARSVLLSWEDRQAFRVVQRYPQQRPSSLGSRRAVSTLRNPRSAQHTGRSRTPFVGRRVSDRQGLAKPARWLTRSRLGQSALPPELTGRAARWTPPPR